MGTAVEWERDHQELLKQMAEAVAHKDPYLAEEIMERLAPYPEGDNVREPERIDQHTKRIREVEVIDPVSGQLDNPNGPALVKGDGTRMWYRRGMQHNASGPAVIKLNGEVAYYYFGVKCKNAEALDETVRKAEEHAKKSAHWKNAQSTSQA